MENLFIGFRVNNRLYGAKSYLADEKEWSASHEMITGFYHRNNLSQMKNLFDLISWESVRSSKRINNGFTFMALLKEDTIEGFAYYRKDIRSKNQQEKTRRNPCMMLHVLKRETARFLQSLLIMVKYMMNTNSKKPILLI